MILDPSRALSSALNSLECYSQFSFEFLFSVPQLFGSLDTKTFRVTAREDELIRTAILLPKPRQSNQVCHLSRLNWALGKNSFGTPNYLGPMRNFAPLTVRLTWARMDRKRTNCSILIAFSCRLQLPCLQVIVLWEDTHKDCSFYPTTVDEVVGLLKRRKLLSTYYVNGHLL